ncbi:TolC family outer membrane protein [Sphingosinicellaceae bacterium]|nr:TolC family outer membrane protein [Sphingosinicellaceae bacterium]
MIRNSSLLALGVALCGSIAVTPAHAETLAQAIASAYETNPDLAAQRAVVRQVDELVPQALSAGRPTVGVSVSAQQNAVDSFGDGGRTFFGGLSVNQSLYNGGRTRTATNAADSRVLAARARLRAVENQIILDVVTAYSDVLRYAAVVDLNANQVKVLERELQASKDRFEVGDLTRTDVAQSDARLANARSNEISARGQLSAARASYLRVVGHFADDLAPLPAQPTLPGTQGQSVDLANANNPALIAARFDESAARYDVSTIERERLPALGVGAGADYQRYSGGSSGSTIGATGGTTGTGTGTIPVIPTGSTSGGYFTQNVGLTLTVPIYQAGAVASRVRQAQQRRSELLEAIGSTSRQVTESATNAFVQIGTARAIIQSSQVAVDANALALEGVTQENQVGTRTIIEVLNAQQELLVTKVNLVTARRDEYVGAYTLLAAVGAAEAAALEVPVQNYNPEVNARAVRHLINDWNTPKNPPALPLPDPGVATRSAVIGPQQ